MSQETVIGLSIAAVVAVMIGIKYWLHNLLKFKMDESAILRFFDECTDRYAHRGTQEISAGADISITRVVEACTRSSAIDRSNSDNEFWCLKHQKNV